MRIYLVLILVFILILTFTINILAKPLFLEPVEFTEDYDEIYAYIETIESFRYVETTAVAYKISGFGHALDTSEFTAF